ncbi:aldehyde dehydrogenase [Mytilinidion resinicola]|uniref:aldehyde dehydrogenase (NAD(+)) n=1 Tax=Mytilinidion resinicola TaxID=574789 RepID=A0A6A6Z4I0_9PEZI|nr:aldehyde dehydrogenase [Mytilinidion resinicola]KAF2815563.1 aldehyde dehydrogenase [Mytilinidion resinicola]
MATNGIVKDLDFSSFRNVIDGKLTDTKSTRRAINPATNEQLWPCPVSTPQDVDAAIQAARTAFKSWSKTPLEHRKAQLMALSAAFTALKSEFGELLTKEQGKATFFAEQEVDFGAYWLAGTCALEMPFEVVDDTPDKLVKTRYTPLGVAVGIVPWNFPIMLLCGKIAPAVMTGNCIIVKPSPFTPYCGIKLVELAQKFFPPGVIQVLSGDDSLGPWLTAHAGIDKISFTGSTATGKRVMESASKTLTRVTLELGGNDPAIICSDIDIATVAPQIAAMAFMNSGQICIAIKRIYVHKDIYIPFRDAFVECVKAFKVGNGFEKDVFLGPVQNKLQYDRVKTFLDDVNSSGQKIATGGQVIDTDTSGLFIQPTVIDNPSDDSKIVVEEPFGPVVPLLQWSEEDEVLARANDTDMGLGASVWSKDIDRALRIGESLEVGSVWINEHLGIKPTATFGGQKQSGIGREWGLDGLRGYCNTQTVFLNHRRS